MNNSAPPVLINPTVSIGISGLPSNSSCMVSGGLYILVAELPTARFPMLSNSLVGALNDGVPCTIILPSDPLPFIQRIESFGSVDTKELINTDRLQVFVMQDEFSKNMFRLSVESFVLELEQFEIPDNSYLIFEQADELLSLHDISLALEQVRCLTKWFSRKRVTALLVFSRITEENFRTINSLMDYLAGIARLGGGRDGLELVFDHWQSPEGIVAAKNYLLQTLDSGFYEASTRGAPSLQAIGDQKYESKNGFGSESSGGVKVQFEAPHNNPQNLEIAKRSLDVSTLETDVSIKPSSDSLVAFAKKSVRPQALPNIINNIKLHTSTFGKKQVPRATRSSSPDQLENTNF